MKIDEAQFFLLMRFFLINVSKALDCSRTRWLNELTGPAVYDTAPGPGRTRRTNETDGFIAFAGELTKKTRDGWMYCLLARRYLLYYISLENQPTLIAQLCEKTAYAAHSFCLANYLHSFLQLDKMTENFEVSEAARKELQEYANKVRPVSNQLIHQPCFMVLLIWRTPTRTPFSMCTLFSEFKHCL